MGLLNTSLVTGRNAMAANQLALDVVGNNIANATTEGYVRQSPVFVNTPDKKVRTGVFVGTGAMLERISRLVDTFLQEQIRGSAGTVADLQVLEQNLLRIEMAFKETTDQDLSTAMNRFFDALEGLQNDPSQLALRTNVAHEARTLSTVFHETVRAIDDVSADMDVQISQLVESINSLTGQVAELNVGIVRGEGGTGGQGSQNRLRDRRDLLVGQLADIVGITVIEQPNGAYNVYLGGDPLVFGVESFELEAEARSTGSAIVHDVVFAADGHAASLDGGRLAGIVTTRDTLAPEFKGVLDDLARSLIWEVNRIHTEGMGLTGFADVTSSGAVTNPTATLDAAGLDFNVTNGSFVVNILNGTTGQVDSFNIDIDLDGIGADSTLNSVVGEIAAEITAVLPQITAVVTVDNRIRLQSASSNLTIAFGPDSSGFLAAMGINTLLSGHDANTFDVDTRVLEEPGMVAAATTSNPGDNSNAVRLTELRSALIGDLGGGTFADFLESTVSNLAVQARTTTESRMSAEDFMGSLRSRHETISGVDMNEEAVNIIRYQNAFRGAGRFIATINRLLDVIFTLA